MPDAPTVEDVDAAFPKEPSVLSRLYRDSPDSVTFRKLRKRLLRQVQEAISIFGMTRTAKEGEAPECWLVCLSGGKDSHAMLALLLDLKAQGQFTPDILVCNLDQGQPGFPKETLPAYLNGLGVSFRIEERDTYSIVTRNIPAGRTYCGLCSRLRRANLYRVAREEGCGVIALGHHRDDAIETLFLNLFHGGRLAAMPPKLLNDAGDVLTVRPLILCAEDDLASFAQAINFPIIPCTLCGSQDGLQREAIKAMLADWEARSPGRRESIFRSLMNVRASHLADPRLFHFAGLAPATSGASAGGSAERADEAEDE